MLSYNLDILKIIMFKKISIIIFALITNTVIGHKQPHDHMKDAFDDISYYHEGKGHPFNATFYHELVECLQKFNDTTLYES